EHVIGEHEVLGVGPVVGEFRVGVVAHHVRLGAHAADRIVDGHAAGAARVALADEPVHLAVVDVGGGVGDVVRAAAVDIGGVVIGALARPFGVRFTDGGRAVPHGNSVSAGIGPEVVVERPV